MTFNLDDIDIRILSFLQPDATISNAELAKKVGMAPSAVLERVKKLEQKGVIEGYPARISPASVELKLLAYIFIKSSEPLGCLTVAKQLAEMPEVLELHNIAGEDCYLAKVRASDTQSLARLMREKFGSITGIQSTKTTVVLETLKEENLLPLPKPRS